MPKKRGRPKKIVTIDDDQPPAKKLKTEKKKRGRRPFNIEVSNGLTNESEDPTGANRFPPQIRTIHIGVLNIN